MEICGEDINDDVANHEVVMKQENRGFFAVVFGRKDGRKDEIIFRGKKKKKLPLVAFLVNTFIYRLSKLLFLFIQN